MLLRLVLAIAAFGAAVPPGSLPPHAGQAAAVRRPHLTTCTFGTLAMAFGTYAPLGANSSTPLEATGSVSVRCTNGGAFDLTADNGLNSAHASDTCATAACSRALVTGTSYVSYDLYTSSSYTTIWNGSNSIAGVGNGATSTVSIFGYIPPGNANTAGNYTDTVTVTVTF